MKIILQNSKHIIVSIFLFSIIGNNFLGAAEEDAKALKIQKFNPFILIIPGVVLTKSTTSI